ncbi:MAG: NAD+ synthase [Myxococcota bacterium]
MKLALAQINTVVGDFEHNAGAILAAATQARAAGAELVLFPELSLTGYPPLDLLERPRFWAEAQEAEHRCMTDLPPGLVAVFGNIGPRDPRAHGRRLFNQAVVARRGEILGRVSKHLIPTYDVFDEDRHFEIGPSPSAIFEIGGRRIGITICEDMWAEVEGAKRTYPVDPVQALVEAHRPELILNLSASPFSRRKLGLRRRILEGVSKKYEVFVAYGNLVGANDGLIFDGRSMVYGPGGQHLHTSPPWVSDVSVIDLERVSPSDPPLEDAIADLADALSLGIRDYVDKAGVERAVVGLSGGIDSAVTAALAVRALGPGRVRGLAMPSAYSSEGSLTDARGLAENLGIRLDEISIRPMVEAHEAALGPIFEGREPDMTEENLQSRIRCALLMAVSNKFGGVVLNTGNKSEAAVGYATIYGDAIGALSVLGDCYKHQVYGLAEWINLADEIIPFSTIEKPPSAELRPNQTDQDTLPPYERLDAILERAIEAREDPETIADVLGVELQEVRRIFHLLYAAEFKRRQFPPTLKVSGKAWTGRVYPIVQRFRD